MNVSQSCDFQQFLGRIIDQFNFTLRVKGDQPDADMIDDGLQKSEMFFFFQLGPLKFFDHLAEGCMQFLKPRPLQIVAEGLRKVGIPDGVQKTRHFPVGYGDIADQGNHLTDRGQADKNGNGNELGSEQQISQQADRAAEQQYANNAVDVKPFHYLQPVFFHAAIERGPGQAQIPGSMGNIAFMLF